MKSDPVSVSYKHNVWHTICTW